MKYGRIERKREGEDLESGWAVRGQKGSYGKDNARSRDAVALFAAGHSVENLIILATPPST